MIPQRVVLENFLSFGDRIELDFDDGESLWVLCGPNGVGKSAVFDAITYALFGCHRGGKGSGMDKLIRHGTNGFHIEFAFRFANRDYRIERNYGKNSVERVWVDGQEIDLPTGRNKVRSWAERELGLTYEQFTASVLLKQGEADRIISGTGRERLAMLKQIIGVEQYEALAERAKLAVREAKERRERCNQDLARMPAVTDTERVEAESARESAEQAFQEAIHVEDRAATRLDEAKQWEKLDRAREQLEVELRADAQRQANAATIRAKHARLTDLAGVMPVLEKILAARNELAKLAPERLRLQTKLSELETAIARAIADRDQSTALAAEHTRAADTARDTAKELEIANQSDRQLEATAKEIETIERSLAELPTDLDERLARVQAERDRTEADTNRLAEERASAEALLRQRTKERKEFDAVEIGATCSRCRQKVGPEHAATERAFLDGEIQKLRKAVEEAAIAEQTAKAQYQDAKEMTRVLAERKNTRENLTGRLLGLTRHGTVPPSAAVAARIAERTTAITVARQTDTAERAKAANQSKAAQQFEAARSTAERELKAANTDFERIDRSVVLQQATNDTLRSTLPTHWTSRVESIRPEEIRELSAELDSLRQSRVADEFRKLQEDEPLRAEREQRLAAYRSEIAAIPEASRVPSAVAERDRVTAKARVQKAREVLDGAVRRCDDLMARIARREEYVVAEHAAESAERIAGKLHDALGPAGLLRDLVRTAERQIVAFANETVANLSDGDLAIELDDAEDGPDQAFTLKIRRSDSEPIGVQYLSGSQKFRVAVAVALAIGRFAASGTQAKPLESVIIDEGFGSLDRDGLRAMADELTRLQNKAALKRILLVSHQEEFTRSFPVGWQLANSPTGTTATRFRQGM